MEVGIIAFTLPPADKAVQLQLRVRFAGDRVQCDNEWPLWSYPKPVEWDDRVAVYDPTYALAGLAELAQPRIPLPAAAWRVVIAGGLDQALLDFVAAGGHGLLLPQPEGVLPIQRDPFWRKAMKLLCPHPLWVRFPQTGFVDPQFFGLVTDVMIEPVKLIAVLPPITTVTPILRRFDAREFTVTDYLWETQIG